MEEPRRARFQERPTAEVALRLHRQEPHPMRHQALLDDYCHYVGLNRSPSTVYVHLTKLRPLLTYWDHLQPSGFTRARFEEYLHHGNTVRHWKPRNMQIYLDVARAFIRWATERDLGIPDFAKGIKKPQVHTGKVVYYTEDEIGKLLAAAGHSRVAITIVFGAYAGMRRTEIYNATWADVDWENNTITVHGTKTHHDREVPMAPTLRKVLRSQWRGQKEGRIIGELTEAWKFNIRRDMRRLAKQAGVAYKGIHSLRRSFATLTLLKGAATSTVMDIGGWRSMKTLTRYAGTNKEAKQAAVNLLG
jgi:integrase